MEEATPAAGASTSSAATTSSLGSQLPTYSLQPLSSVGTKPSSGQALEAAETAVDGCCSRASSSNTSVAAHRDGPLARPGALADLGDALPQAPEPTRTHISPARCGTGCAQEALSRPRALLADAESDYANASEFDDELAYLLQRVNTRLDDPGFQHMPYCM